MIKPWAFGQGINSDRPDIDESRCTQDISDAYSGKPAKEYA